MAAAARRSSSFLRCFIRTNSASPSLPSNNASFLLRFQNPKISPPPSLRFRRESLFLNSLLPIHTATASARLVSKLPKEASMSTEGRFANYLSPI